MLKQLKLLDYVTLTVSFVKTSKANEIMIRTK